MKKIVFALLAAFTMSSVAMAQETTERKQLSETEMIKNRTDRMAKKYGLDDSQTAKLLELNTKFANKLPRRGAGLRGPRPNGQKPALQKPENDPKFEKMEKGKRPERPDIEKIKKNMEEYNIQLKAILSEEQYKSYQSDMEKMRQRGPRNRTRTSK